MRRRTLRLIAAKELLDTLRDRRTLFIALVLPLLLYPALLLGLTQIIGATQRNLAGEAQKVLLEGGGAVAELAELLRQENLEPVDARDADVFDAALRADIERLRDDEDDAARGRLRAALDRHGLAGAVVCADDFRDQIRGERQGDALLLFDPTDEPSKFARRKVEKALRKYAAKQREGLLARYRDDAERLKFAQSPVRVRELEVASSSEKGAYSFAPLLGMLIVVMALTGAFYPAVDLVAGEKERGTLETLLVAPVTRREIVMGKFLAIWLIAVVTALLNLLVMGLTFSKLSGMLGTSQIAFELPLSTMLAVTAILIPTAALFSAIALALSSFATSYKEGQHYLSPLFLVAMPLAMVGLLPNVEIGYGLALIPISNVVLLVKAMLLNHEATGPAVAAVVATAAYAGLALAGAVALFRRESVLFRTGSGRGVDAAALKVSQAGLPREAHAALLFFVVLALMFFLSSNVATTWEAVLAFFKTQFLGVLLPVLFFAYRGKVDFKETFSLRGVRPRVIPAVLIAAPATLICVLAFYHRFIPEPKVEGFEHLIKLLEAIPRWAFFVMLAIIPPVCEEVLCRGYFLSAFKGRYGERTAVLLAAALFGALHMSLVRFPGMFAAGIMLGYVCVRTRSLYMAILFHMVYNGIIATPELAILILEPTVPMIVGAMAVLAGCILFLERTARSEPPPTGTPPEPEADPEERTAPDTVAAETARN